MKRPPYRFLLFCLMIILIVSCTEFIDIELDSSQVRLVVDGGITNMEGPHTIHLRTSTDYFHHDMPPVVSQAQLTLTDGDSVITLLENPSGSGNYLTPLGFQGQRGHTYTLNIHLAEPIGDQTDFQAVAMMPTTAFEIDSIALLYEPLWEIYALNLYAFEPSSTDFYKADVMVNGLLVTDTANMSVVTDDRFVSGNYTNGLTMIMVRGSVVQPGDTVTLLLSAISQEYFNFFSELQSESGISVPLFSGPPANISSNLRPGGLGYFYARYEEQSAALADPNRLRP